MHYEWNDGDEVMPALAVFGRSMDDINKNELLNSWDWQAHTLYRCSNGYMMNGDYSNDILFFVNKTFPDGFRLLVLFYNACKANEVTWITKFA